jgi:hypothetical protein
VRIPEQGERDSGTTVNAVLEVNTNSGLKPNTFAEPRNSVHRHPGIGFLANGAGHNRPAGDPSKTGESIAGQETVHA